MRNELFLTLLAVGILALSPHTALGAGIIVDNASVVWDVTLDDATDVDHLVGEPGVYVTKYADTFSYFLLENAAIGRLFGEPGVFVTKYADVFVYHLLEDAGNVQHLVGEPGVMVTRYADTFTYECLEVPGVIPHNVTPPSANVSPAAHTVDPGDNFSIEIFVNTGNNGVSSGQFDFAFDPSVMQVDSVTAGDLFGADPNAVGPFIDNAAGTVSLALARKGLTTPPTPNGVYATLMLTVDAGAADGTYALDITNLQLLDENFTEIAGIVINDGAVNVKAGAPSGRWDINEDCTVNFIDLTILSAHWLETTSAPYPRYDINEDGVVNFIDLTILSAHWLETTC